MDGNLLTVENNCDGKEKYSSHKLSNYTSNNYSRQESNINDYLIDDDGEEYFDPNDDEVSSLASVGESEIKNNDQDIVNQETPVTYAQNEGKELKESDHESVKSKESEDIVEESQQYDIDDQTYFEDFSAIDSIAVDVEKVSKMKSYMAEGNGQSIAHNEDGSFNLSIGNKKIEAPNTETMERKYFDEYIEAKEEDEQD